MGGHYSSEEKRRGRFWWLAFSVVNTFSFQFLAGNVILLFIIRLGASKTLVGVVSSFFHIAYLFMPLGRMLSRKVGIVRAFSTAWLLRYIAISPILLAPLIAMGEGDTARLSALWIVVAGYFGFQMLRAVGLVSYSPVLTELTHGSDRGRYLSQSRILTDIAILLGVLLVAFFLGDDASYLRYMISFALGIGLGYFGVYTLNRIPEIHRPAGHRDEALLDSLKNAWKQTRFRRYFTALLVVGFVSGVIRPFMLVYVKDVYAFSDNLVLFLTVAGSLGAVAMGFLSRSFLDRVGAKPMLLLWIILMAIASLAMVLTPVLSGIWVWIFLVLLFFVGMMGLNGADNTTQTYFFSMIEPQQQLNYGIIYFLATGISGATGASLSGAVLDALQGPTGMDPRLSHVWLSLTMLVLLVLSLFLAGRMERLGAMSFRRSLSEMFTLRQRNRAQDQ